MTRKERNNKLKYLIICMKCEISGKCCDDIVSIPPVIPQKKMGHWIDDKCSECGKGIEDLIDSREWYRNEQPNFCPFCGLKLVYSQESEVKE